MEFIRKVNPDNYNIPMKGHPFLHRNLEWYATEDDKILGVVNLDLIDNDYGWVVLSPRPGTSTYYGLDSGVSRSTQDLAKTNLFAAMLHEWKNLQTGEQK